MKSRKKELPILNGGNGQKYIFLIINQLKNTARYFHLGERRKGRNRDGHKSTSFWFDFTLIQDIITLA
jgi:hypothetical protein